MVSTIILKIENQKQQDQLNSLIPLGFLYTQFPNQTKPSELWPKTKWSEITSNYSGLFFRAEGGESGPFGQIQQANQSWISDIHLLGCWYKSWSNGTCYDNHNHFEKNKWTRTNQTQIESVAKLEYFTTGGEVRPKNTAIKIWKRIQ